MSTFKRKAKAEVRKMSIDDFCDYMEEWDKATEEKWNRQTFTEAGVPQFKTKDEARKYFKAISFEDFEQKYLLTRNDSR